MQFSSLAYSVTEGSPTVDVAVTRTGDTTGPSTVLLQTSDSAGAVDCNVTTGVVASSRCDYEIRIKTVRFAAGETSKTVSIFIIDNAYTELPEAFVVTLSDATGGSVGYCRPQQLLSLTI